MNDWHDSQCDEMSLCEEKKGSRFTPGRWQSKTLSTIDEPGSKIDRNNVFDCHLSSVRRQKAIENSCF